jgi:hypothetical protein
MQAILPATVVVAACLRRALPPRRQSRLKGSDGQPRQESLGRPPRRPAGRGADRLVRSHPARGSLGGQRTARHRSRQLRIAQGRPRNGRRGGTRGRVPQAGPGAHRPPLARPVQSSHPWALVPNVRGPQLSEGRSGNDAHLNYCDRSTFRPVRGERYPQRVLVSHLRERLTTAWLDGRRAVGRDTSAAGSCCHDAA